MKLFVLNLLMASNLLNVLFCKIKSNDHSIPPKIKTIIFKSYNQNSALPVLVGNETLKLSFDDLTANENDYY